MHCHLAVPLRLICIEKLLNLVFAHISKDTMLTFGKIGLQRIHCVRRRTKSQVQSQIGCSCVKAFGSESSPLSRRSFVQIVLVENRAFLEWDILRACSLNPKLKSWSKSSIARSNKKFLDVSKRNLIHLASRTLFTSL